MLAPTPSPTPRLWTPSGFRSDEWRRADYVLFVTDNRFEGDGAGELPMLARVARSRVRVLRGGRTARVFELSLYARRGRA